MKFAKFKSLEKYGLYGIWTLLDDLQEQSCLQVEVAVVIYKGKRFVKATYLLDADDLLVFSCFNILSFFNASIHAPHVPKMMVVAECLSGKPGNT